MEIVNCRVRYLSIVIIAIAVSAAIQGMGFADPGKADALLTLEGEAALRDRLSNKTLIVKVLPNPLPLQDTSFLPSRFGGAVRVEYNGDAVVLTSYVLVGEAAKVELLLRPGSRPVATVHGSPDLREKGLAVLECTQDVAVGKGPGRHGAGKTQSPCGVKPVQIAPRDATNTGRLLFYVVLSGDGRSVLSHTVSKGEADPKLPGLIVVYGRIPKGTPLFDTDGRVAAIVVRSAADSVDRVLAATLLPDAASTKSQGER